VWTDAPNLVTGLDASKLKSIYDDRRREGGAARNGRGRGSERDPREGGTFLVLHHRVAPSVDRSKRVLSRVYHHDYLELFSLVHVSNGLYTYVIREKPVAFPPNVAAACALYLGPSSGAVRYRVSRRAVGNGVWDIIASIRGQGQALAVALGRSATLQGALDEVAEDLEIEHRRHAELYGLPRLADQIKDLTVEVHRVYERAEIEPRAEDVLEGIWEMGIDGAFILRTLDGATERGVLPGSEAFTRSARTADEFLRDTAAAGHMTERRPWRDSEAHLELLRDIHYLQTPDGRIDREYRGVPPIPLSRVTLAATRDAVLRSATWYENNIHPDGSVLYKVWPSENRYSDEYNHVRHTLATWNLVTAWSLDPKPEYLALAERAQDWTLKYLVEEDGMAYYSYDKANKLGSVVVGLMGMIDLSKRRSPTSGTSS
jgi:hypothetical protein